MTESVTIVGGLSGAGSQSSPRDGGAAKKGEKHGSHRRQEEAKDSVDISSEALQRAAGRGRTILDYLEERVS